MDNCAIHAHQTMNFIRRYIRWLHTKWPAGQVEKLPVSADDGSTNVPGLYIAGDLRGIPLLKFAADSGARVIQTVAASRSRDRGDAVAEKNIATGRKGVLGIIEYGAPRLHIPTEMRHGKSQSDPEALRAGGNLGFGNALPSDHEGVAGYGRVGMLRD
jgi:hypothetical protein